MTAPLYSGEIDPGPSEQPLDELQTPLSARFTAGLGSDLAGLPTIQARRMEDIEAAKVGLKIDDWLPGLTMPQISAAPTPEIPIEEAKARVAGSGLTGRLTLPDEPSIREGALNLMINNARADAEREDKIRRGPQGFVPSALDVSSSFLVGAVDPLNVAAFSIPVIGEARYGYLLKSAGESVLGRAAVRAGVGAAQGAVGGAALAPLDWAARTEEGQDYSFSDALAGIIQTAGAGALFHAGPPLLGEAYARLRGRPLAALEGAAPPPGAPQEATAPVPTGNARVDDLLARPEVVDAIANPTIERGYDVPYGAGSSRDAAGITYVDRHIPTEATINGVTFDPAIPVSIHEQAEREAMERDGMPYLQAHRDVATVAERAWVQAHLGPDAWGPYTHLWDGWLSHIEHENPENPPPDLYDKPYPPSERLALEKRSGEAGEGGAATVAVTAPPVPAEAVSRETPIPANGAAAAFDALPDRAKEDAARMANAALIQGEPVRIAEALQYAAASDPRIAQALTALDRDPTARSVFDDVRTKLVATGMEPLQAEANAAVWAARYAARASRLGRGNAASIYREENVGIGGAEMAAEGRAYAQRGSSARNLGPSRETGSLFDQGPEGTEQTLIPGVKPLSDKERMEAAAKAPLRGGNAAPQEGGLFGEGKNQRELFQGPATVPAFYSAVERSIAASRLTKASPEQWLATLKNTAGVKPEEMKWLGLEDWLKEQKGPVTREEVADYVRANRIDVQEFVHGRDAAEALTPEENARYEYLTDRRVGFRGTPPLTVEERAEYNALNARYQAAAERSTGTKFESYRLPGGENYRELLLTLPEQRADPATLAAIQERLNAVHDRIRQWEADHPNEDYPTSVERLRLVAERNRIAEEYDAAVRAGRAENYRSPHWDEPNILAHIRFDDRAVDGERALHIAEVQSDWHQHGRREGYKEERAPPTRADVEVKFIPPEVPPGHNPDVYLGYWESFDKRDGKLISHHRGNATEAEAIDQALGDLRHKVFPGVPDAPFKTTWPELAIKRVIRYAAENGYDRLTWDTGETNAERYDLSKRVSKIRLMGSGDNLHVTALDHDGRPIIDSRPTTQAGLVDLVGKEAADKLLAQEVKTIHELPMVMADDISLARAHPDEWTLMTKDGRLMAVGKGTEPTFEGAKAYAVRYFNNRAEEINKRRRETGAPRELSGLDLKVGGEGMAGFYDKILPAAVAKLTKRFGGKVEDAKLSSSDVSRRAYAVSENDGYWVEAAGHREGPYQSWKEAESAAAEVNARELPRDVHSLALTPELKQAALSEGFPLFQAGGAEGARGKITFRDNDKLIQLFARADASTFMHESAHLWLDELARDATGEGAPAALKRDFQGVLDWLGAEKPEDLTTEQHEKFAQGFEQYLAAGHSPLYSLQRVFDLFKEWLTGIYRDLAGLGEPISPDVRGVFDRMLTPEERARIVTAAPRRAFAGRRAVTQPQTLVGFLKAGGGLKSHPELTARDARRAYPGLVNDKRGMTLDRAREAAAESGFLGEPIDEAMANTDVNDFLAALDDHPHYRDRDADQLTQWQEQKEGRLYRDRVNSEIATIESFAERTGTADVKDRELIAHAAELALAHPEMAYDDALERAAIELYNRDQDTAARLGETEGERGQAHVGPGADEANGRGGGGAGGGEPRPGAQGIDAGARPPVPDADRAWRDLAEPGDRGDSDLIDASEAAATAKEPASVNPMAGKSLAALDASLGDLEEQWAAESRWLNPEELAEAEKAIAAGSQDEETRAESLKDLLACMTVAEGA